MRWAFGWLSTDGLLSAPTRGGGERQPISVVFLALLSRPGSLRYLYRPNFLTP